MEWYIAKVKPRSEWRVQEHLSRHGIEVWAPEILVIKRRAHHREPLFPGYVFVNMYQLSDNWNLVRWARGLSYFLPAHSQPQPVSESLVTRTREHVEQWNTGGWAAAFSHGDRVAIKDGPLKDLDSIFQRYMPGKQRCEVLVSLVSKVHRVQVEVTDLHTTATGRRFAQLGA